jgi:serine/threonine protein kinase
MDTGATVTQIGKYPVLGVLGVGGMGVVYRGMDKSVGREVAIKTLTEATEELRQRFLLEARSGILNHPNIVTVYDFGEQDGNPYIVMEFVPGDSLENLLRAGHQFTLIQKLDIVRQLCLGLGYAHSKGVIHRDIKPANIMVQPDGEIKIVDFGVARLEQTSGHTQTGMVIGTFHYISPERLLGKPADGRADIWSAGVILYLLLTGRLPFPGDDPATLHRVVREPQEPLSNFLTDYPQALDRLLDTALAKSPNDRYDNAEDMAADIEAINEGLKRDHVTGALNSLQPMIEQEQWTAVRPMLLDLQKLNPKNTEVKKLLRDVQEKLSRQQKNAQIRQLMSDGEEAVLTQHYSEAQEFYNQALDIDPANPDLQEKIENVRQLREKASKVAQLLEQSREARKRADFNAANQLIERALQLDDRNTDLRNERARILQDAERATRERNLRQFSEAAKSQLAARQYTDAIQTLRSALEIDPTDAETQQLFQQAIDRQEEQRRRRIIDQIVAEISECITCEEFDRALVLIQRAQERLPGEPVLLQLKSDAEVRQQERTARLLVEKTTRDVYNLLATNPTQALAIVHEALEQMPDEARLIDLESRVNEQAQKVQGERRRSEFLKQAQTELESKHFDQAIHILGSAAFECGESPEFTSLLNYAQEARRKAELDQRAANAIREALPLIASGKFDIAIGLLEPVAKETGNGSVEQLLRKATTGQAEAARRIDAVLSQAQSLGQTSAEQATQLLAIQPPEILEDRRVTELRTQLEESQQKERRAQELEQARQEAAKQQEIKAAEQEGARQETAKEQERIAAEKEKARQEAERNLTASIQAAVATLDKKDNQDTPDLRSGLATLESLKNANSNSPLVSAAISHYKNRRSQLADGMLNAAMASATQLIEREERKQAAETLAKVAPVAEFADTALQANLKRLAQEAAKSSPKQPAKPETASASVAAPIQTAALKKPAAEPRDAKAESGAPIGLVVGIIVVLLVVGGGAAWWFLRPAPAAGAAILEITATPFGEVVSITADSGKAIPLPAGDHGTPLRIDSLPAGNYTVVVKGADGNAQKQTCEASTNPQVCVVPLKPVDDNAIDQIIGGAK